MHFQRDFLDYNYLPFITISGAQGTRKLEGYHILEYIWLQYQPELSPFISGGPRNNELNMSPLITSSSSHLEAVLARILYLR